MAGFLFFYIICMLLCAIAYWWLEGNKPKEFLTFMAASFFPALMVFSIFFPHVIIRGW